MTGSRSRSSFTGKVGTGLGIRASVVLAATTVLLLAIPRAAQANYFDDNPDSRADVGSPERFALELRIGPYTPSGPSDFDTSFGEYFSDDSGPILAAELDVIILRIPAVGLIGVGGSIGTGAYSGNARERATNTSSSEETTLSLTPMSLLGVARIDLLARTLGVPFVFTGKLGLDAVAWSATTGSREDGNNISTGLRWAAQVGLELDFFDRRAARSLDEEWGINHSLAFFEIYGSTAASTLPVGTDLAWAAGLGFVF